MLTLGPKKAPFIPLVPSKGSYILKQTSTSLFKYVRPFSGHKALKG